jgi:hypothetical protein
MKLKKALRGYYQTQVDSVDIAGGIWAVKAKDSGAGSRVFSFAFHTALVALIISAILLGRYQPSRLEQCMGIIVERYNVEDRLTDSLESLIINIQKNRKDGGEL